MFYVFIALLIAVCAFLLWGAKLSHESLQKLKDNGFEPNQKIMGLLIDEKNGLWCKSGMDMTLKLSEITDCEIDEDGISYKSDNGVVRAVVGGALFGGVGAVVGAVTASKSENVSRLVLNIYTSNPLIKKIPIVFISQPTSKGSNSYRLSVEAANNMILYLDKISGFSARKPKEVVPPPTPMSSADELAKYKSLLDNGAITQSEYDDVKKKLMNI